MSFTDLKVVALLESSAPALSQEVDGMAHGRRLLASLGEFCGFCL